MLIEKQTNLLKLNLGNIIVNLELCPMLTNQSLKIISSHKQLQEFVISIKYYIKVIINSTIKGLSI